MKSAGKLIFSLLNNFFTTIETIRTDVVTTMRLASAWFYRE